MGRLGCGLNGELIDSSFSEPMPWIGLYVAAASAACALAMAVDALHAIFNRMLWFPCRFFSLNATTLTLITVATKLSVDLNTAMPSREEQLAKLSSSALVCAAMANFLPSLGGMDNKEVLVNMIALGILIITVIANTCIQLGTGVIYMFCLEHTVVMLLMLALLVLLISSALTIPATKSYFDHKYKEKFEDAMNKCKYTACSCQNKKLRDDLTRFWMMAHTCSPQFVMARLVTCTATGAVCLLSTAVLAEAGLRSYSIPKSLRFCHGESDYKWSSPVILITQFAAIGIGNIAPVFRWFNTINFRCPKEETEAWKLDFKVEEYWTQKLTQWREHPLLLGVYGQVWRKVLQNIKDSFLGFCILLQTAIVCFSKLLWFVSIYLMSLFLVAFQGGKRLTRLLNLETEKSIYETESPSVYIYTPESDLRHYVLHLEGEENLIDVMMKRNYDATDQWITMGQKKQPKHLLQLLEAEKEPSGQFLGVWKFDNESILSLGGADVVKPPNCWAMPVVTLTSIVIALANTTDFHFVKDLIRSTKEGLNLIRMVEQNLDTGELTNIRKAADMAWLGVELNYKWLGVDLRNMPLQEKTSKEVFKQLAEIAKTKVRKFLEKQDSISHSRENPSQWPFQALAANSMYRICKTLLLTPENKESTQTCVKRLSSMIADIMGACLTNLRRVISMQCHQTAIEAREESVRHAMVLLGKTKELLRILDQRPLPNIQPDQLAYIDQWRASSNV